MSIAPLLPYSPENHSGSKGLARGPIPPDQGVLARPGRLSRGRGGDFEGLLTDRGASRWTANVTADTTGIKLPARFRVGGAHFS